MKILLMTYECSPYRGSEWAVGWGRLLQASRVATVHVVTSESNYAALLRAREEGLLPAGVFLHTPVPDARLRRLERTPGLFAYNYVAYEHWQRLAFLLAKELHARERFHAVHQVNVVTFREPGYCWQLDAPFLWGPMGGSQNFPPRFLSMLPPVEAFKEGVRGVSNWLSLRCKRRVRRAANAAAAVLAANSTNQRHYRRVFARDVELLLETGLNEVHEPNRSRFRERLTAPQKPLAILWSGECQSRKALPVLLRALHGLPADVAWTLRVLGDGPQRARWEAESARLGLRERVSFEGRLPFAAAVAAMQGADLFCFTSLRDTSGNVVLEALAAGVPVVCFDHQGAGDMVTAACGWKLPVRTVAQAVSDWAGVIRQAASSPDVLLAKSEAATVRARAFLWEKNGDRMNALYRELASHGAAAQGTLREEATGTVSMGVSAR